MSHTGSDGSNLQTRADRVDLPWGQVGENVAAGFTNAKAVVMAWMCSPAHRKNLMSCDFSQIGVGAGVSNSGRNYYTQVFSCGISETCGCGSAPSKSSPSPPPDLKDSDGMSRFGICHSGRFCRCQGFSFRLGLGRCYLNC